jgi:hypothetical protein
MYHSMVLGQSSRRSLGLDWPLYFISLQLVRSLTCHGNLGLRAALKRFPLFGVTASLIARTRLRRKIGCQSTCRALLLVALS